MVVLSVSLKPVPPVPLEQKTEKGIFGYWLTNGDVFTVTALTDTTARLINYKKTLDSTGTISGNVIRAWGETGTYTTDKISWSNGQVWAKTNSPVPPANNIDAWIGKWINPADNAFIDIKKADASTISLGGLPATVIGDTIEAYGSKGTYSAGKITWTNGITWIPLKPPTNINAWVGTWKDVNYGGQITVTKLDEINLSLNGLRVVVNGDVIYAYNEIGTLTGGVVKWTNRNTWTKI